MSWKIAEFLESKNNALLIDGVSAVDLAERFGTPLFVFSEARIRHNIERLKKARSVIDCELKVCYAAKANSNMGILRVVKESGCDLEVNSGGELWKALEVGFRGDQIIFNGTSKEVWEIEKAIDADIFAIQVDSLFELSLIEETARRLGKRANVSLRLVPEIETKTHSGLQTALLTSKFGMMPDEALSAFREHKSNRHLNLCGIHLHIGSQNADAAPYSEALRALFDNMVSIHRETGIRLSHLNLGGGFPVNYLRDGSHSADFAVPEREMFAADFEPSDAIASAWKELRAAAADSNAEHLLDGLTLLLEPGRSVIADTGICLTTVRNQKTRPIAEIQNPKSEIQNENWLLTDAGFNILLSMETYKWYYHIVHASRADDAHDTPYKLAGPLCDGGDVYFDIEGHGRLPDHRLLPAGVRPNDVLALLNCGAYSIAQMFQYNGRFLPAIVLTRSNGEVELIRKRDEFAELVANDLW
ncbi:MAG: diaminopimelate decarboxylase [Acidobacteria bacterium]|nr:diaminopimelate decarboxylase [Acidobacteriota bacterium]